MFRDFRGRPWAVLSLSPIEREDLGIQGGKRKPAQGGLFMIDIYLDRYSSIEKFSRRFKMAGCIFGEFGNLCFTES